jgi:thermolysin
MTIERGWGMARAGVSGAAGLFAVVGILGAVNGCSGPAEPGDPETSPQEPAGTKAEIAADPRIAEAEAKSIEHLRNEMAPLGIDVQKDIRIKRTQIDELEMAHTRVQQLVSGVPVFGGEAIVHLNADGSLFTVTDQLVSGAGRGLTVTPTLLPEKAADAALGSRECRDCFQAKGEPELWVLRKDERDYLVYRVELADARDTVGAAMPVVFVDAHTGEKVWEYDNSQTGTGTGHYSTNVTIGTYHPAWTSLHYLEDHSRNIGTYTNNGTDSTTYYLTDNDGNFNAAFQKAGVDVQYAVEASFDYFLSTFGRTGMNGSGGPTLYGALDTGTPQVTSKVNVGVNVGNAGWNGSFMWFGDGDGSTWGPLVSIDIVGHEFTHGVTQYTAGLIYANESGALNESMSDVFGAMIERRMKGESDDTWKLGEQVFTPGIAGDTGRSLADPHSGGWNDPDHYSERYTGALDNGGVHSNSGIANKAFYLLAKGGTHRLGGTMMGIGATEAAAIWYKALTTYMTNSTDFNGARTATLNAAAALHGAGSAAHKAVGKAWTLVGVVGAGGCVHHKCGTGAALSGSCDPGVATVCAADSYCCNNGWDSQCVAEVRSISNSVQCAEAHGSCTHNLCTTGGALVSGCDTASCVDDICAADSFCCNNSWDAYCVAEVASICGKTCD